MGEKRNKKRSILIKKLFSKKPATESQAKKTASPKPAKANSGAKTDKKPSPKSTNKPSRRNQRPKKQKAAQPAWDLSQYVVAEKDGETRFHDLDLPDSVMHAVQDLGYEYCSPIQAQILPHTLQRKDAIGKAQTGTGKTAAFLITIIDDLLRHEIEDERYLGEPRAVIVAPTRELAMQIASDAVKLCKYTDLNVITLFGGADYKKQHNKVQEKLVDIIVATPGRLIDFMTRGDVFLDRVECLVLDEADRMLDMGFIPQVKRIVRATPDKEFRQTLLFSATFNHDVLNLSMQWTTDPVQIEIEPESVATDTVDQKVYLVSNEEKFRVLVNILKLDNVKQVIIFTNRRDQAQRLYDGVRKKRFKVGILSGEVSQAKRTSTLKNFKSGDIRILVATDVAGRGIHVDGVTHVINYTLPDNPDDYVHRIGRTGRAGETGTAINLACEDEAFQLPAIESFLGQKFDCNYPPEDLLKAY